jgi:hypothetical protein
MMVGLISIDIEKDECGSRLGVKDVDLNATIVEGTTSLSMVRHESVIMKECDGMFCEERCIVVIFGIVEESLVGSALKTSDGWVRLLNADDVGWKGSLKVRERGGEGKVLTDIP